MDPLFSEFSYGYTITEELATGVLGYSKVRPIFPSLREEGQVGGGYDVALPFSGAPLYLQFKRAHFMKRVYSDNYYLFNAPYFRMYLMQQKYSPQHELLIHLELYGNEVYYVAPEFYTDEKLAEYYNNNSVFYHSALFIPSDIDHLDDERHYIAFDEGSVAYICSEKPRMLKHNSKGKNFPHENFSKTLGKSRRVDKFFFDQLIENSIEILEKRTIPTEILKQSRIIRREAETISEKAKFAGFLARAYFGCELFIVSE